MHNTRFYSVFGGEIVHFWPHSREYLQAIVSDGTIHPVKSNDDAESTSDNNPVQIGTAISCVAHHPRLPNLLAYGHLTDQSIRLIESEIDTLSAQPHQLQCIKYHDGFLGQRLGHIDKVMWHPNRMVLGTITNEVFVSIYGHNSEAL